MTPDPLTPGEFYRLMDLEVWIEPALKLHECVAGVEMVAIIDAEGEIVCCAPLEKAPTLVKILNRSVRLVDRDA